MVGSIYRNSIINAKDIHTSVHINLLFKKLRVGQQQQKTLVQANTRLTVLIITRQQWTK